MQYIVDSHLTNSAFFTKMLADINTWLLMLSFTMNKKFYINVFIQGKISCDCIVKLSKVLINDVT